MQLILSKLNNNKVCSFIFKYKIFFVISLISIFLFLSGFWYPFYFFASAVAIVFYLFSKPTDILCLLMFSEMFSVVQHYFMIGQIAGVVSLLIHYIIDVVKKRKKVAVIPLALTLFILVCYSLIHYRIDQNGIIQGLNIIFVLVGTYLIFVMNKDIDILKSLKFLTLGLLVSIVLSLFSLAFSNYSFDVAPFDGVYYRLKLFTYHTNYLSMLCLFLISFSVYKIANKKDKFLFNILEIILCLVVGILTLSKAFLVVFVGIVCFGRLERGGVRADGLSSFGRVGLGIGGAVHGGAGFPNGHTAASHAPPDASMGGHCGIFRDIWCDTWQPGTNSGCCAVRRGARLALLAFRHDLDAGGRACVQ